MTTSPTPNCLDQVANQIERLLLCYEELRRTNSLLQSQLQDATQERDLLKTRLLAARTRLDAVLERLPEAGAVPFTNPASPAANPPPASQPLETASFEATAFEATSFEATTSEAAAPDYAPELPAASSPAATPFGSEPFAAEHFATEPATEPVAAEPPPAAPVASSTTQDSHKPDAAIAWSVPYYVPFSSGQQEQS